MTSSPGRNKDVFWEKKKGEKGNKKAVEINSPQLIKYFYDQTKQTSLLYVLGGIS